MIRLIKPEYDDLLVLPCIVFARVSSDDRKIFGIALSWLHRGIGFSYFNKAAAKFLKDKNNAKRND